VTFAGVGTTENNKATCEILCCHGGVAEGSRLLICTVVSFGQSLQTFRTLGTSWPRRWRHCSFPKLWQIFTNRNGIISQRTLIF